MGGIFDLEKLYYGVAYYREYMPYERLAEDIQMMKEANINVVRIGESTWSTHELKEGEFNFEPIDEVLNAMYEAGIDVIVGTPTYAVPSWLVKKDPNIMVTTKEGTSKYGARQIMDITNETYLFHAERLIKKLITHVVEHPAVIGFQLDNETKHYGTSGSNVQKKFVEYLKNKFETVDKMNEAFGTAYWSNSIGEWEDFPSTVGTINGSIGLEFDRFQQKLVTNFLTWQSELVREIKKKDHFITHNFDFEWRGYSFGVQPDVNHYEASKCLDITGVDIYHPSQETLTGKEISFAGDIARSTKQKNYLVLETQAQAFKQWLPFPGQLTLQAFSHIASGANMIEYWHWHSIHNSYETFWKGLLGHDFKPNPTYNEAKLIGGYFNKLSDKLVNLKRKSKVALVVSNDSLSAMNWFPFSKNKNYNDLFRQYYDTCYELNIPTDVVSLEDVNPYDYNLLIMIGHYVIADKNLLKIKEYISQGGTVLFTFKSGFSNENNKVRTEVQPGGISDVCGIQYSQFVEPRSVFLESNKLNIQNSNPTTEWMELLEVTTAESLASYKHKYWGKYSAITKNNYNQGVAYYVGCYVDGTILTALIKYIIKEEKIIDLADISFPIIVKSALNQEQKMIHFYFNYSDEEQSFSYTKNSGIELLGEKKVSNNEKIKIEPWGVKIFEEE